jgi:hypothetical protein
MSKHTFSVLTSDLTRNPELHEAIRHEAAKYGTVMETIDGKVTTIQAVAA